ncbi:MAG: flagellin FliC [bacterium]|jgi:flagellin|nr:flagellin FliC [bacterium]MBK7769718.1 flagellin FliC [bacterium]MBK9776002.1 flagellin FliC [bacterium]
MGLRIGTNVAAMAAQRHLANATARVNRSLERLSSGLRINRAADDPAGLAVSERLRGQMRALEVGARNAADGISLLQTADGGLESMADLLIRLNELTQQAMTGTVTNEQRGFLDSEFQALVDEIDRIAVSMEFNGRNLLDGSGGSAEVRVGSGAGIGLDLSGSYTASSLGLDNLSLAGNPASWAEQPLSAIEDALQRVSSGRASFGASQNRLESVIRMLQNQNENLAAADSRIRDVDYAAEVSELTSAQILQQMAVAMLAQAQRQPSLVLRLLGIR